MLGCDTLNLAAWLEVSHVTQALQSAVRISRSIDTDLKKLV